LKTNRAVQKICRLRTATVALQEITASLRIDL
jgi:hypothetical protein